MRVCTWTFMLTLFGIGDRSSGREVAAVLTAAIATSTPADAVGMAAAAAVSSQDAPQAREGGLGCRHHRAAAAFSLAGATAAAAAETTAINNESARTLPPVMNGGADRGAAGDTGSPRLHVGPCRRQRYHPSAPTVVAGGSRRRGVRPPAAAAGAPRRRRVGGGSRQCGRRAAAPSQAAAPALPGGAR